MKYIMLSSLLFMCNSVYCQTNTSDEIPLDPELKIGTLENGFTYYIRHNEEPKNRAQLYLVVKAGSVQESDQQKGLAHFIEHMAFNGTKSFPKNELIDYLQKAGIRFGADLNAYTGFNETVYQLPLPTDSTRIFEAGFKILAEWAGSITLNNDEIDKERGVIIEEERQRGNDFRERMNKKILPVLLSDSRYQNRLPIGDIDVIENVDYKEFDDFYNDWYRPDLQAVIAVGDFDEEEVERLIKKNFSNLHKPASPKKKIEYTIPENDNPLVTIVTDPEYPYTVASVIFKHPETVIKTTDDFRHSIIRSAINSMLSGRINDLLKSGKAPFLNAGMSYAPYQGGMVNMDAFSVQVVPKNPSEIKVSIEGVMDEVRRMVKFGFTESELLRVKKNFITSVNKGFKEKNKTPSKSYVNQCLQHFLNGEAIIDIAYSQDFYNEFLSTLKVEEVNEIASQMITDKNQIILLQSSEKNRGLLPDEELLLEWVQDSSRDIKPYIDDVLMGPLIKNDIISGTIENLTENESLGYDILQLDNGIKVILKPTSFKNDEILFSAFSPGGISLASPDNIISSKVADNIIPGSGVGNFTSNQLNKMLSGKSLYLSPYISTYSEGFKGSAAPQDLESVLKLLYLFFTEPRKDTIVYQRYLDNTVMYLKGKSSNPMAVFQDSINAVINGKSQWAQSLSLENIRDISLDKAFQFYKNRFSNAGDFTFLFVGNFEVDSIKTLLAKYLGSLPSHHKEERYKDVGIKPLPGKISKKIYKGIEDKAVVVLSFHDEYEFEAAHNLELKAIKFILENRMLQRLREKEGGVYSPSVSLNYIKIPAPYYSISISFSCGSDSVEKLIAAVNEEVDKLKAEGPTLDELDKFIIQEKRQREIQIQTNSFWLNYLENVYWLNLNPESIVVNEDLYDNLKRSDVRNSARKFLTKNNFIEMILLPEVIQ